MFNPRPEVSRPSQPYGADPSGYPNLTRQALERRLSASQSRAANRSRDGRPWISDPVLRAARLRAEILHGASN